jgi:hypothetical protein
VVSNAVPDSSTVQKHTVTAVHVTYTDRNFDDVTVATASGEQTITTTQHHLFWDATLHAWREADNLSVGDQLDTPGGGHVTVVASRLYTDQLVTYNLTVDNVHTYYVDAGTTPVLVHNCGEGEASSPVYRPPHSPDLDHELGSGPNPTSHQMEGGDNSVYFGEQSVAADYQGIGDYTNGSIRYGMHPDFEPEFADVKFRYDWKGPGNTARYEWQIPLDRLERFNELTLNRTWVPAGGGV